jgi:hypothetical protein
LLAVPAVAGTVAMLAVTRRGAYLSPDALAYVGTARNLVDGGGFTLPPGSPPLGNFPPVYPLLLAAFGALGPDPLTVARFVGPAAFGATILLVGLLVRNLTGSMPLAVLAQLLVFTATDLLAYHSAALSEPVFLLLALVALAALGGCLERRRSLLLLGAALLAGAACLTRYVGLAVVAAGAVGLVLLASRRADGRRQWRGAIAFGALALAPLFGWLAWVSGKTGRATNREAVFHAPDLAYATRGLRNASTWVLPAEVPTPVRFGAAALAVLALVALAWRTRRQAAPGAGVAGLLALFGLAYLAALVVDRTFFDVTGRLDSRFLLPVHVSFIVLAAWALRGIDLGRSHVARIGVSAVVGVHLVSGAVWLYDATTYADVRPGGFTAPAWEDSEVIDQVRALDPSTPVYTNAVDALFFHTGREAAAVPEKNTFLTGRPNPAYRAELQAMGDRLGTGGLLVYFTAVPARRAFLPTPPELAQGLGLAEVARDAVGVAYRVPRPPA